MMRLLLAEESVVGQVVIVLNYVMEEGMTLSAHVGHAVDAVHRHLIPDLLILVHLVLPAQTKQPLHFTNEQYLRLGCTA